MGLWLKTKSWMPADQEPYVLWVRADEIVGVYQDIKNPKRCCIVVRGGGTIDVEEPAADMVNSIALNRGDIVLGDDREMGVHYGA